MEWNRLSSPHGQQRPQHRPRAAAGPPPIRDGAGDRARHGAAAALARIFLHQRTAATVGPARRSGGAERARRDLDRRDQVVVEDLRADQKWHEYRAHCDRLFFAFTQDLPCEIFPQDTGLIIADAYGAHLHCEAPEHKIAAATRKQMTVRFAMAAALRINRLVDPQGHADFWE
ncbi:hypothetical protein NK6_3537 [Bradyrhizobium diazoefficiens]|uniref:Uncharacterized protein n=1 Tax=Bradyrhizobium diazoefficiens TaxID=1355477 RepID=A0A0E4BNI9_9BRAD|nr:hypothetical protein NK6_3537 [Bradyrhizobium diazoefficiens]